MNQSSALYGKSFYDLAKEENITKEVLEEMELVKALFKENPDISVFCWSRLFLRRKDYLFWTRLFQESCSPIF